VLADGIANSCRGAVLGHGVRQRDKVQELLWLAARKHHGSITYRLLALT
jgi:hypothetical protein